MTELIKAASFNGRTPEFDSGNVGSTPTAASRPSRRALLRSGLCLLAAPAIVRFASLMPVRQFKDTDLLVWWQEPYSSPALGTAGQQFVVTEVKGCNSFYTTTEWREYLGRLWDSTAVETLSDQTS